MKKVFYLTIGSLIAGLVLLPANGRALDSQNAENNAATGQKVVKQEVNKKETKKADKKASKKASSKKDASSKKGVKDEARQKKKPDVRKSSAAEKVKSPAVAGHARYVASKNSSKKYYHLATSGVAKRIKPENLIEFSSREEAEKAGYHPDKDVAKN